MPRALVVAAVVLVAAGCGGADSGFVGSFAGQTSALIDKAGTPYVFDVAPEGWSVSQSEVSFTKVCPAGDGDPMVGTGSGPELTWTGEIRCGASPNIPCSSARLTYQSAKMTLRATGELWIEGVGLIAPCSGGSPQAGTMKFVGKRSQ